MRKYREYIATSLVQQYMADHRGMPDGLDERLEYFSKRGYTGSDIQECMIASTCFLGFQKTKQAYRFRKGLTDELMGGGPMDFFLSDLHLPFLDLYLDFSGCGKTMDGFQAIGAYVSVVMDHSIPTICMLGVIRTEETRRQDGYRLVYLSMDGLIHRTIQEQLDRTTGDLSGDREFTELIIRCLAYISSEKPDVQDRGQIIVKGSPYQKKQVPARVHTWDVGYRYVKETRGYATGSEEEHPDNSARGTRASPRPHMRRGHWHTYRTGPGRKERKVIWVASCQVGSGEQPTAIRIPDAGVLGKGHQDGASLLHEDA